MSINSIVQLHWHSSTFWKSICFLFNLELIKTYSLTNYINSPGLKFHVETECYLRKQWDSVYNFLPQRREDAENIALNAVLIFFIERDIDIWVSTKGLNYSINL